MSTLAIDYDADADAVTIEGIRYSGDLFRHFGIKANRPNQFFKITNRSDGIITIRTINNERLSQQFDAMAIEEME